jgi:hypothetical protein
VPEKERTRLWRSKLSRILESTQHVFATVGLLALCVVSRRIRAAMLNEAASLVPHGLGETARYLDKKSP